MSANSQMRELVLPASAAGQRLDRALADALDDLSRTVIARLIEEGRVSVDGARAPSSRKVKGGERITCDVPDAAPSELAAEDVALAVLYEDEHLVVIDKPAGMVVHPGAGVSSGTLVNALLHHCGDSLVGVGGERRPGIVHRLDRGTTGAIIVAKTSVAHQRLSRQFAVRTVDKTYFAVATGVPRAVSGRIEVAVGRSATARTRMEAGASRGRPALTEWTLLETFGKSCVALSVALRTGRTHQARVHLAHAGHPLVGDATYGRAAWRAPNAACRPILTAFTRPALHAWKLAFDHPDDGRRLRLEAPLPSDLTRLCKDLRHATRG